MSVLKRGLKGMILVVGLVIALTTVGCTDKARLNQALANANISLVGQDNGVGGHCDGLILVGDTVILTYNFFPNEGPEELLKDAEVADQYRPKASEALKVLMKEYPTVAKEMIANHAAFIYRRKFANTHINRGHSDVKFTPEQVEEIHNLI